MTTAWEETKRIWSAVPGEMAFVTATRAAIWLGVWWVLHWTVGVILGALGGWLAVLPLRMLHRRSLRVRGIVR